MQYMVVVVQYVSKFWGCLTTISCHWSNSSVQTLVHPYRIAAYAIWYYGYWICKLTMD